MNGYRFAGVVVLLLVSISVVPLQAQSIYTVTNADDTIDPPGTLRWALEQANSDPDNSLIDFQIDGGGSLARIAVTGALPTITAPVTIDGWTQTGANCPPSVDLDGAAAINAHGLWILNTTNCVIRGMIIHDFPRNGILISQGGRHQIYGNYIGTDAGGTLDMGNGRNGIALFDSPNNSIGLWALPYCAYRNILSGNAYNGLYITAAGSMFNQVANNYIGVDVSGELPIQNDWHGVMVEAGPSQNDIGGTATPKPINVISGNQTNGIYMTQDSLNNVWGNFIGLNAGGSFAVPNGGHGVELYISSSDEIGNGSSEGRNTMSGNLRNGVYIRHTNSAGNSVFANYIGTDRSGIYEIGNQENGVMLDDSCQQNYIGSETVGTGNLISGNRKNGVIIANLAHGNTVKRNLIGLDNLGVASISNREYGVVLSMNAYGNTVGTTVTNDGNAIAGNIAGGVLMVDGATGNDVAGNKIGLNVAGMPVPNWGDGVRVQNASANGIGGPSRVQRNVISGNLGCGIQLGTNVSGILVYRNFIGTDTNGLTGYGNGKDGVRIVNSSFNTVDGTTMADGQVIAGNAGNGVAIVDSPKSFSNRVYRNFIGVSANGLAPIPNGGNGVWVYNSQRNPIGDGLLGNVISGNGTNGVYVEGSMASENVIRGNLIGANATGSGALSNGMDGVRVDEGVRNQIGGMTAPQGNDIVGNGRYGVVFSSSARENALQGNRIGATPSGAALPNEHSGVVVHNGSSYNMIGGTNSGAGNMIAYNRYWGILVLTDFATNNAILGNSIHNNGDLGIALSNDGITPNDAFDPDLGPNNFQNYPVLYGATTGSVLIGGGLGSWPGQTFRVEFFWSTNGYVTGHGQGQVYLGHTQVTTEADGSVSNCFIISFTNTVAVGDYITATATDPFGNTSEFSAWIRVTENEEYDADGDGMPGIWETANGLDPNSNVGTNGAAGDPDTDYYGNYDEYVADTGPKDSSSYLAVLSLVRTNEFLLIHTSTNTRYYVVQGSERMVNGAVWSDLYTPVLPGSNGVMAFIDEAVQTARFYRVKVQITP